MTRVLVTGLGVRSPVGQSPRECFAALADGRSGIRPVSTDVYPGPHALVAGFVDFDASAHWTAQQLGQLDRATQLALAAAGDAIGDAGLELTEEESWSAGVYWGTGLGGATSIEQCYHMLYVGGGRVRPTSVVLGMNNAAAGQISIANGLRGPLVNVSTACSSSATSIGEAYRAIKSGYANVIVAGGSESLVTDGNLRAWNAMQALAHADAADPARSCKPFSASRSGIVLGEGAAALVLECAERAERRGAHVYAEIVGYGNAADAWHISKPDASGQARAIRAALADAKLAPDDIGYLNAHGTATIVGDVIETNAIKRAFGDAARRLPVSSTKALHGHLMGGTGALEMLTAIMAMNECVIPPTAHLDDPDPQCDLDYVPNHGREARIDAVMSNAFGFGGMNAVLVARRYQ